MTIRADSGEVGIALPHVIIRENPFLIGLLTTEDLNHLLVGLLLNRTMKRVFLVVGMDWKGHVQNDGRLLINVNNYYYFFTGTNQRFLVGDHERAITSAPDLE